MLFDQDTIIENLYQILCNNTDTGLKKKAYNIKYINHLSIEFQRLLFSKQMQSMLGFIIAPRIK